MEYYLVVKRLEVPRHFLKNESLKKNTYLKIFNPKEVLHLCIYLYNYKYAASI